MPNDAWYYLDKTNQQVGPIPRQQIEQMVSLGQLPPETLVWTEGMPNWQPAANVPGLTATTAAQAGPSPGTAPQPASLSYARPTFSEKGKAIASFVCALVGLFCFGVVLGPAAIILGYIALNGMRQTGNTDGKGLAMAGLIIGAIDVVVFILVIIWRANLGFYW